MSLLISTLYQDGLIQYGPTAYCPLGSMNLAEMFTWNALALVAPGY